MTPLQIVSVIIILKCANKYLLVQRAKDDDIFPGKWQNLGGKVELGERLEECIQREIFEEIGLRIKSQPKFIMSYSWKKDETSPVRLGLIFQIDLSGKTNEYNIILDRELENCGWFSIKEANKLDTIGKDSPTGTLKQLLFAENKDKI